MWSAECRIRNTLRRWTVEIPWNSQVGWCWMSEPGHSPTILELGDTCSASWTEGDAATWPEMHSVLTWQTALRMRKVIAETLGNCGNDWNDLRNKMMKNLLSNGKWYDPLAFLAAIHNFKLCRWACGRTCCLAKESWVPRVPTIVHDRWFCKVWNWSLAFEWCRSKAQSWAWHTRSIFHNLINLHHQISHSRIRSWSKPIFSSGTCDTWRPDRSVAAPLPITRAYHSKNLYPCIYAQYPAEVHSCIVPWWLVKNEHPVVRQQEWTNPKHQANQASTKFACKKSFHNHLKVL